jgi:hypothetical protein
MFRLEHPEDLDKILRFVIGNHPLPLLIQEEPVDHSLEVITEHRLTIVDSAFLLWYAINTK